MTDAANDTILSEKYGFEPFGTLAGVLSGGPVKIMPLGTFYRDDRKLEITEADLQEIERNFKAELPRFRVPVNENHQGTGKIGTVKTVAFDKAGADGPGLYAGLDLTDEGKELLKRGRYDAVSPEMVWQKNGSTYQDPKTNQRFSNVLVGLAICDRPFFSHEHVALFSAHPPDADMPKRHNGYTKLRESMRAKFDELMAMVMDQDGDGEPDAMSADAILNTAVIPDAGIADKPAAEAASQGVVHMADPIVPQPTPPATEIMVSTISADEFAALKTANEKLVTRLAQVERAARKRDMSARVESFVAISAEKDGLAENLLKLQEQAPDLFAYFDGLLGAVDGELVKADLFSQVGDGRARKEDRGVETFESAIEKVWIEKYDSEPAKYEAALLEVSKAKPALARGR